jgi:hypothetical protein
MLWFAISIVTPAVLVVTSTIEYLYPGKLRVALMKAGWDAMELLSKTEIYVSHLYNTYVPTIFPQQKAQPIIKFICDGDEVMSYNLNEFLKKKKNGELNLNYDFIFYETPIIKKDKYDKYDTYVIRYDNINDVLSLEYNSLKCFELNMIQLTLEKDDNQNYPIDFGRKQFMVSGNVLFDRPFLKWYLTNYNNITLSDETNYTVTFIDHNMNYNTLPDYCYLLVKKNDYDIVNIILE